MRWLAPLGLLVAGSLAAACADPSAVAPPTDQMMADCVAPTYATDMLVCNDQELRALDAELARLWEHAASVSDGDAAAGVEQAAWFRERSRCAFMEDHRGCVVSAYRSRIVALLADIAAH